jgi:hypothetical protein
MQYTLPRIARFIIKKLKNIVIITITATLKTCSSIDGNSCSDSVF